MKKFLLPAALVMGMAAAAHAQVTIDYSRHDRNSSLRIRYSSGYGYGYGGFYSGFGGGYYAYGSGYNSYYGPGGFTYGFYPGRVYTNGPSIYGYGTGPYAYTGGYGGVGYYRPAASTDAAGPLSRTAPVSDRVAEFAAAREIEEGRRRLKTGDYRSAVDQFRASVAAHPESALAQAWFAVALAISGDGRNADKALKAAVADGLDAEKMSLADAFQDDKERAKVTAALSRTGAEGGLSAAFALSLAGDGAKLKQLAEKDPVARKLLPKP